jgi:hypothetical protein
MRLHRPSLALVAWQGRLPVSGRSRARVRLMSSFVVISHITPGGVMQWAWRTDEDAGDGIERGDWSPRLGDAV